MTPTEKQREQMRRELEKLRGQQHITTTPAKISRQDFGRLPQLLHRDDGDF